MFQKNENKYGTCERCGGTLTPVFFTEYEEKVVYGCRYRTGRYRRAVSHLTCDDCCKNYCVDDSFDGPWYGG